MVREVNQTFLTFVPKVKNTAEFGEVRPIAWCNTLHKILSKILTKRLKVVIG